MASRPGWTLVGAAALLAASGAPGCGATDAVVADRGLVDSGAQEGSLGARCTGPAQCEQDQYCSKISCDTQEVGVCTAKPKGTCDNTPALGVCGCSGVQYWNDCLRKQHGEVFADPSTCARLSPCSSTTDGSCAFGSTCALRSATCGPFGAKGVCVVLPDSCPGVVGGIALPTVVSCAPGDAGGCMDFCSAVKARVPFHEPTQTQACTGP
jgi:hypothetical protein